MSTANGVNTTGETVRIEKIISEDDFEEVFECMRSSFGLQTRDPFWLDMNPGHDTFEGRARGVESQAKRWRETKDAGHTHFLKAVICDKHGTETIGGIAIWAESNMERNPPAKALEEVADVETLYPGDEDRQRFLRQVFASFVRRQVEVVKEASAKGESVMVLNVCCVRPEFQRRGLATKLVQWGIEEAKRKGGNGESMACFTEASPMGRPVHQKLGFEIDSEMKYDVDEQFASLPVAPNTHLYRPKSAQR